MQKTGADVQAPDHSFELLLNATPEQLWPLVTNTERLNAATGLPHVTYRDKQEEGDLSRRFFFFVHMGINFAGEEYPSTWHQNRFFEIHRVYSEGPFIELRFRVELDLAEPDQPEAGCFCRYLYWIEPRGELGQQFLLSIDEAMLAPIQRLLTEAVERMTSGSTIATWPGLTVAANEPTAQQQEAAARLGEAAREFHDSAVIDRVQEAVLYGADVDLARIRPLSFARVENLDPDDTLSALLACTRSGLLNMSWQLVCPHCRGSRTGHEELSEIEEIGYCESCDIDFEVNLSKGLELVFRPHPQVRDVNPFPYCLGGPASTPHFLYQNRLRPDESCEAVLDLPPGVYRIRAEGVQGYNMLEVASSESTLRSMPVLSVLQDGVKLDLGDGLDPDSKFTFAGGTQIPVAVHNSSARSVVLRVEDMHWPSDSLVAADVVASQEFRNLFDSQLLAPGVSLGVESITILFTDLVGSTAMYQSLGDSDAFSLVWHHFDFLKEILAEHRGSLVKTIGDAVMAVFPRPADAQLAACAIQEQVTRAMAEAGYSHPVYLKMGIHTGAAITITANGRLDYFGSAVNLAARTESKSRGRDIVVTLAHAEATRNAANLRERGWQGENFTAEVKGFDEAIRLQRFTRAESAG